MFDLDTFLFLLLDGITNGAAYGLVALSLVLVFTVTRVVNIAQGEYITVGALCFYSALYEPRPSIVLAILGLLGAACFFDIARGFGLRGAAARILMRDLARATFVVLIWVPVWLWPGSYWFAALAALGTVSVLAAIIYRLTVGPAANAPPLILVVISVGVYMVMHGAGLLIWGAEPHSVPAIAGGGVMVGAVYVGYQSIWVCAVSALVMLGLYVYSERTIAGRALQAAAINRVGAELCGISVSWAGQTSFALAGAFSALSGLLLAPLITAHYEMGFAIGLKAFVAAALGGISEYPMSIVGVLLLGNLESFSAFGASAFRDVILFSLIIPILLWRNAVRPPEEHEG